MRLRGMQRNGFDELGRVDGEIAKGEAIAEHITPQQFAQLIQDDLLRWQKVIDTAKVPKVGY